VLSNFFFFNSSVFCKLVAAAAQEVSKSAQFFFILRRLLSFTRGGGFYKIYLEKSETCYTTDTTNNIDNKEEPFGGQVMEKPAKG
jgi:hypothetical protein